MPIKQFFLNGEIKSLKDISTMALTPATCQSIKKDEINWDDAERYVNDLKTLLKSDSKHGEFLSYSLTKDDINTLFAQDNSLNAIRIYLAYCSDDKTVRAFAIAGIENDLTGECDDWNIPELRLPTSALPLIANTRPCPYQCGKRNFLNKPIP